jgi:hypothetical protein
MPLIDEAQAAGTRLWLIDENQIGFRFADKPPPGLLARLRAAKAELLFALQTELEFKPAQWRCQHPLPACDTTACLHCGTLGPDTPVLASGGHAWLHRECCLAMDGTRQREAERAVRALLGLPLRALSTRVYDRTGFAYKTTERRAARPGSVRK